MSNFDFSFGDCITVSHSARRRNRDENPSDDMAAAGASRMLRIARSFRSRFRSLSKAFDKERYAKVEVMRSSPLSGTR